MKKRIRKLGSLFRTLRLYARSLGLIWEASPSLTLLSLTTVTLTGLTAPLQVWMTKLVIDRIFRLLGGEATDSTLFLLPLALYTMVWLVGQVSQSVASSVHELVSIRFRDYALYRILQKAAELDFAAFENPAFHDQMSLAKDQAWRLENSIYDITSVLTQAITLVSMLVLLGSIGWALPIVVVLTFLPKLALTSRLARRTSDSWTERAPARRMIAYLAQLLSERKTVKEIRLFQLQSYLIERRDHICDEHFRSSAKLSIANELAISILTFASVLGTAGIWLYTGLQAVAGQISLGDVAVIFQATERSRMALDQMAVTSGWMTQHIIYLDTLFSFLDLAPDAVEGALHRREPREKWMPEAQSTIEFRNVSFRYPGSEREVLQHVSFAIRPGQKAALVGENGAGKTTLVKLLARLYDPTEGAILIDGRDLREIEPEEHYRQLAVLFQDFGRYELTAKENIGFGDVRALEDAGRIAAAAQKGGAAELVEGLPQAYETPLGRRFEGSTDLSGGEWQKLALSRAFMRQASLLILDEPTAALDARAEHDVYRRFATLTEDKTTLFVTHRLSSVRMADRILVLKDGRLIEEGTHDALMEEGGEYAAMFTLQAERYQANPL
ncbi:MAG: ABC transporter ATP-binding protein [Anaerolineae bacterium]